MAEPVTLAEARAQVNIIDAGDTTFDTFLTSLIAPARAYVERCTRRFWVAATRTEVFNSLGDYLEIYRAPIASIDSITYGSDGTGTDYDGAQVNLSGFPVRIYPAGADDFTDLLDDGQSLTVTFTSGALSSTSEEYLIGKRAMLLLIGFWFENRGEVPIDKNTELALEYILDDLRPISAY